MSFWVLYAGIMIGLFIGAGIVMWRATECGHDSAIPGKCLVWIESGIKIEPVPEAKPFKVNLI